MKHNRPKNSGMILILSVLVIGSILGTLIIFSNLITRELQQSRLIDQSIVAHYLAESGAERALHQTRRREAVKPEDCPFIVSGSFCQEDTAQVDYGKCTLTSGEVSCITNTDGSLNINGDWAIDVKNEEEVSIVLGTGESFQIDLFSPYQGDNLNLINAATGEDTLLESFVVQSDSNIDLFGELVNLTHLSSDNPLCSSTSQQPVTRGVIVISDIANNSSGFQKGFTGQDPINPECAYVLRISNTLSLDVDPDNLAPVFTVSIHDANHGGEVVGDDLDSSRIYIPSRLVIQSEAVFGNSLQRVEVHTPVRPPLSGLYDFVLFSEQEIVK